MTDTNVEIRFSPDQLTQAGSLLDLSDEQLLESLGREGQLEGFPEDWIRSGRKKYQAAVKGSQEAICSNKTIESLCTNRNAIDATHLVCAIADVLVHLSLAPVPAATISVLIVHQGLHKFCTAFWPK